MKYIEGFLDTAYTYTTNPQKHVALNNVALSINDASRGIFHPANTLDTPNMRATLTFLSTLNHALAQARFSRQYLLSQLHQPLADLVDNAPSVIDSFPHWNRSQKALPDEITSTPMPPTNRFSRGIGLAFKPPSFFRPGGAARNLYRFIHKRLSGDPLIIANAGGGVADAGILHHLIYGSSDATPDHIALVRYSPVKKGDMQIVVRPPFGNMIDFAKYQGRSLIATDDIMSTGISVEKLLSLMGENSLVVVGFDTHLPSQIRPTLERIYYDPRYQVSVFAQNQT